MRYTNCSQMTLYMNREYYCLKFSKNGQHNLRIRSCG